MSFPLIMYVKIYDCYCACGHVYNWARTVWAKVYSCKLLIQEMFTDLVRVNHYVGISL